MNKASKLLKPLKQKSARELLAVNVRMHRARLGMTKEELANVAGIDRGYIGQIESEARSVSVNIIDRLALGLQVSVAQLFIDHGKDSDTE